MGEHAVLHGYPALIAATNKTITVCITVRDDNKITINSLDKNNQPLFATYESTIEHLADNACFNIVITALKNNQAFLNSGCDILIKSTLPASCGLGSSTALTVACIGAINQWLEHPSNNNTLYAEAKALVKQVQGIGSGADVAASVLGGLILYKDEKTLAASATPVHSRPPLSLVFSGNKVPTAIAVSKIDKLKAVNSEKITDIFKSMRDLVASSLMALNHHDLNKLGDLFNAQQALMRELHLSTPLLEGIVETLNKDPNIYGCKISGAGLGDCIIAVGSFRKNIFSNHATIKPITFQYAETGVRLYASDSLTATNLTR